MHVLCHAVAAGGAACAHNHQKPYLGRQKCLGGAAARRCPPTCTQGFIPCMCVLSISLAFASAIQHETEVLCWCVPARPGTRAGWPRRPGAGASVGSWPPRHTAASCAAMQLIRAHCWKPQLYAAAEQHCVGVSAIPAARQTELVSVYYEIQHGHTGQHSMGHCNNAFPNFDTPCCTTTSATCGMLIAIPIAHVPHLCVLQCPICAAVHQCDGEQAGLWKSATREQM